MLKKTVMTGVMSGEFEGHGINRNSPSCSCCIILLVMAITGREHSWHEGVVRNNVQIPDSFQDSAIGIMEPKVSQENIANSITLPPPACVQPTVDPGTIACVGHRRTCDRPSMWCTRLLESSDQAIFVHGPILMTFGPFPALLEMAHIYCHCHIVLITTFVAAGDLSQCGSAVAVNNIYYN